MILVQQALLEKAAIKMVSQLMVFYMVLLTFIKRAKKKELSQLSDAKFIWPLTGERISNITLTENIPT